MAFLNGWGRGTWGELEWGEGSIPVTLTGLSATSALTAPGVNGQAVAAVAGITATLGAVSVTINADANATPAGLESTSALGTIASVTGIANIFPTGLEGTSALGTVTPQADADVSLDGASATLGNVSVLVDAEATIIITTGVAATGSTGTLSTITDNRFPAPGFANLRASDPFVNPTVNAACNFTIIGVSATGQVGTFNIWEVIDDSQNPNWTEIAA